jgi:hypothetical protein
MYPVISYRLGPKQQLILSITGKSQLVLQTSHHALLVSDSPVEIAAYR